jgi:hypothetical protein
LLAVVSTVRILPFNPTCTAECLGYLNGLFFFFFSSGSVITPSLNYEQ